MSIKGILNGMADVPSRSYVATGEPGNYCWDDITFLTQFNLKFPLTQGASWQIFRLRNKLTQRVFSLLVNKRQPMGCLTRLPKCSVKLDLLEGLVQQKYWSGPLS